MIFAGRESHCRFEPAAIVEWAGRLAAVAIGGEHPHETLGLKGDALRRGLRSGTHCIADPASIRWSTILALQLLPRGHDGPLEDLDFGIAAGGARPLRTRFPGRPRGGRAVSMANPRACGGTWATRRPRCSRALPASSSCTSAGPSRTRRVPIRNETSTSPSASNNTPGFRSSPRPGASSGRVQRAPASLLILAIGEASAVRCIGNRPAVKSTATTNATPATAANSRPHRLARVTPSRPADRQGTCVSEPITSLSAAEASSPSAAGGVACCARKAACRLT